MTDFLTCRKIMDSCLAVSASFWPILGAFGLALQNVGLMLGCGCHHGVLMVSPSCLGTALAVCLRFRGVVGCGCVVSWFGGSYWWYVSRDLVASWWSVGDVLVQPPQCISVYCAGASWWRLGGHVCASCCVCELFYWCCGGI